MTSKAGRLAILFTGLALACAAPAGAAPGKPAAPRVAQAKAPAKAKRTKPADGARAQKRRDRIRQRIRAARQWRLTEALELDEATADKLFPILDSYDDKFVAAMRGARELRDELREAIDGKAAESKINGIVDKMLDNQREIWTLNEKRFQAARKVLTAEQAAKALVILPEIDRAIRREMRKAMKGGPGRRGRHRGPGPGPGPGPRPFDDDF